MSRRSWIMFSLLSAIWGSSYLFIKIGLEDELPPAAIVFMRTALAALLLWPLAAHRGALTGLRERWPAVFALAAMQVAAPFFLITAGEQHISSSLTGILVATAPLFTYLLAFAIDDDERAGRMSLTGVAIGIAGVVLLLGVDVGGSTAALVGGLMVVLASFGYALGSYYLKRRFAGAQPIGVVTVTMAASALMTLPALLVDLPPHAPGAGPIAAMVALGAICTGVAFVLFYELLATEGATRSSLVAYVAPGFAVIYGVTLLGEGFGAATAAGLVLIVGGSWLAAEGQLPWRRRAAAQPKPLPVAGGS